MTALPHPSQAEEVSLDPVAAAGLAMALSHGAYVPPFNDATLMPASDQNAVEFVSLLTSIVILLALALLLVVAGLTA